MRELQQYRSRQKRPVVITSDAMWLLVAATMAMRSVPGLLAIEDEHISAALAAAQRGLLDAHNRPYLVTTYPPEVEELIETVLEASRDAHDSVPSRIRHAAYAAAEATGMNRHWEV